MGNTIVGVRQPPRVMLSLDYDLGRVLDLRAPSVLEALGLTTDDLNRPWKLAQVTGRAILTQRIGAVAHAIGIEGLLVPSFRAHGATNLVIFPDQLRKGSTIEFFVGEVPAIPQHRLEGRN